MLSATPTHWSTMRLRTPCSKLCEGTFSATMNNRLSLAQYFHQQHSLFLAVVPSTIVISGPLIMILLMCNLLSNAFGKTQRVISGLKTVCACACALRCVWLFVTPQTIAHQAPLSEGFSRQEYWSRLPFSSPGYLPDSWIKPPSLVSPALAGGFFSS